jgi:WS/DGAT/MGAT family acyltransferase
MTSFIPLVDLVFLWIDRPETPSNVGIVLLFDPPEGRSARSSVQALLRRYRAASPSPPFDCVPEFPALGLPRWRKINGFDPKYHVQSAVLGKPGGPAELREKIAELHRDRLDRSRPLFQLHLIDGLATGQFAVYLKSHHASWDGRSAMPRVFGTMTREPGPIREPFFAGDPGATAAAAELLPAEIAVSGLKAILSQTVAVRELFSQLTARASSRREAGAPSSATGNQPFGGPKTRFNRPLQNERSFAHFSLPLAAMREVASAFDTKVNDVILSVVDAGAHRYLSGHGESPEGPLVAMVPVSLREPGDEEATTKVASMFVPLGRPRSGAARRLDEIVRCTRAAKAEFDALSNDAKLDFSLLAFGIWFGSHALGMDAFTRPVINLVISNVGGVPGPYYLGQSRLAGAYPVSMLGDPVGLNVTMLSVGDRMDFGIVANRAAIPDPERLAEHCSAAFATLHAAARRRRRIPAPSAKPTAKKSRRRVSS